MKQEATLHHARPTATPTVARPPLLILSVATGYGGAERNIETLLPLLLAERPVTVFACNPLHLQRLRLLAHPALEIHEVDASREDFADGAARLLVQRFLALRPSAILSNTMDSLRILARAAGWLPGLDAIACVGVHDFLWFDHAQLLPQVPRATLLVPDRAVLEKPDYLARHVWPHGPMRALVMPNPVDIPETPASMLAADAPFLHLATVNRFKGHALLVRAAALLGPRCPGLRIASVGHRPIPELYGELQAQMAAAGTASTLSLHDHVDDPSTLLRGARAVLVTSVSAHGGPETFGRSIIEAWAHGRPVIAFACGAPAQLIRHDVDGLLVDEGDVAGLAAAIERLHRDPALADRLGRAGRERTQREFATPRVLAQLTAVLDGAWCPRPQAPPAGAGLPGPGLLFDVSVSLEKGWHSPVGISRVEHHTGDLLAAQPVPVQLVRRGADDGGYRRLTGQELEFLANMPDGIGRLAAAELAATPLPPPRVPQSVGRSLRALGAFQRGKGRLRRLADSRLGRWLHGRASANVRIAPIGTGPFAPGAGDMLLSVSNPWDYVGTPVFQALRARGVRVVLAVHDLMVWETPQWTAGRDPRQYTGDMLAVIAEADQLVAVSRYTAGQVQRAMAEAGRAAPPLRVAAPAGLDTGPARPGAPPPGLDLDRPFVLYCSTLEIRKNHILLLHVWEQLRQRLPAGRLPMLVLAGRWGWGVDAARLAVERNWRLAPDVRVVESPRDEHLQWLYRHARFAVFPSFNEGFGLPVAESLAAGTPVLLSDHPAIVEASAGLMPALDPDDGPAWRREIERLCTDDAYLAQLRDRARAYRAPPADDLPRALLDATGLLPRRAAAPAEPARRPQEMGLQP
ncbi:glycosyltransferase involved in cell wall biosynthesis [Pseudacidovorax intermedius]|uniref:Glycosyltransferase involved in cell wall biosynthesis n=1 Tax=Pseudacidovorax intermedius TaxID=433924 RepID=A0A370FHP1_9BURK|nr:glycosyltransferase involved in cell wall biosynthesis [Pseudacidovorax intermedius]